MTDPNASTDHVAAILIGRNEGPRLVRALEAAKAQVSRLVYVDSGSTDGSQAAAEAAGATVVALDMSVPFTAARARNAGIDALRVDGLPDFIQFLDGDCALQPGWIEAALAMMAEHPDAAVVCGRRREIAPEVSLYNRLIDKEWDTPIGKALACGGDALIRVAPLIAVGGYNPALIAGEEPEMCVRLRAAGWDIWRIDAEMTLHDAAMTRFGQWWKRARRAGHAFAEGAAMHGAPPERHFVTEARRGLIWGAVLPVLGLLGWIVWWPLGALIFAVFPAQIIRLGLRSGDWPEAALMVVGKFAEARGALEYWWNRITRRQATLIEYK